jgi:hypothetical protein
MFWCLYQRYHHKILWKLSSWFEVKMAMVMHVVTLGDRVKHTMTAWWSHGPASVHSEMESMLIYMQYCFKRDVWYTVKLVEGCLWAVLTWKLFVAYLMYRVLTRTLQIWYQRVIWLASWLIASLHVLSVLQMTHCLSVIICDIADFVCTCSEYWIWLTVQFWWLQMRQVRWSDIL